MPDRELGIVSTAHTFVCLRRSDLNQGHGRVARLVELLDYVLDPRLHRPRHRTIGALEVGPDCRGGDVADPDADTVQIDHNFSPVEVVRTWKFHIEAAGEPVEGVLSGGSRVGEQLDVKPGADHLAKVRGGNGTFADAGELLVDSTLLPWQGIGGPQVWCQLIGDPPHEWLPV